MWGNARSAVSLGINSYLIDIQVDIANGLPQLLIVGLPDTAIKEARERVRSAIRNSGYDFPPDKITVNLAPADVKKEGPAYDLPIALAILAASGIVPKDKLQSFIVMGELALNGEIRPVSGSFIVAAEFAGRMPMLLPEENVLETAMIPNASTYPIRTLTDAVSFLRGESSITRSSTEVSLPPINKAGLDFSEVRSQSYAKRAIEIAAAGGHNLLMVGPPGSGKTMLAKRIPSILPPLDFMEFLEIMKIHSCGNLSNVGASIQQGRPFRAPHHTISTAALAGGGSTPRPGEVSLAHGGVLFLDELPEFRRDAIECLRSPLEDGEILISRAKHQIRLPARFMLVSAMNPCPCGWVGNSKRTCRCSLQQIQKYQQKISGPILDRIDIHIEVPPVQSQQLLNHESLEESSSAIRERVLRARKIQLERFSGPRTNASMGAKEIKRYAKPDTDGLHLLEMALKELRLSARAYFKILKIARTIGDLSSEPDIKTEHIAEAIQYRNLDRLW